MTAREKHEQRNGRWEGQGWRGSKRILRFAQNDNQKQMRMTTKTEMAEN
jgi:hypothetical protein